MDPIIFIRADANAQIGTGHIMRCMSIARACKMQGSRVVFITADHKADKLLIGCERICLGTGWTEMEKELDKLIPFIDEYKPSVVLVDSYYVTEKYFDTLRSKVRTVYIDDLNEKIWNVDCLINYNIYADEFDYSSYEREKTRLLLSPLYAPLRKEFQSLPAYAPKKLVRDIFVSAGGSDPEGITERMIEEICPNMEDTTFHFVIGALNPSIEKIKKLRRGNVVLHINEQNMSRLMRRCDMAIAAAGSTLYELCACGIPTITYTLADNQLMGAKKFSKEGIMVNAGDCRENKGFINILQDFIIGLKNNYEMRAKFSETMQRLVDGNGADRIVNQLWGDFLEKEN